MEAIRTIELVKRYKKLTAVDTVDLEIRQGELFSLLGVNGAGKTTMIKMLSCLTKPTSGDAFVGGYSVTKEPEQIKRLIGVSPQETAVAPNLSVKENLELICGIHGFSKEKTQAKIDELNGQFALDTVLNRKAGKLSGGWQRRVSIAMALISEPQVLFLDEPTLGLDVLARHDLWDVIRALKGKITIVLTTHYMEEAETLSDRIGIMKNGRLLAVGTAEELNSIAGTNNFEDAFVAIVKEGGAVRMMTFAKRCTREILRDPINLCFGLGFPVVLLFLLSAIQANIPVSLFAIDTLTPGITVFGLSFITLFSATLIAKDRESAFLQRLYTTPLTGWDFILGYMLPLLPIAIGQTLICYLVAIPLGLDISINILYAVIGNIPVAVFYIALGLFCGSILGVKQVGGICGALLTNLSAWLSGVWFDLHLVGGFLEKVASVLPFFHAAEMEKALFSGNFTLARTHILPILLYSVLMIVAAVYCFLRQMKRQ